MITNEEIINYVRQIKGPSRNIWPVSSVLKNGAESLSSEERAAVVRIARMEAVYKNLPKDLKFIVDSDFQKKRFLYDAVA